MHNTTRPSPTSGARRPAPSRKKRHKTPKLSGVLCALLALALVTGAYYLQANVFPDGMLAQASNTTQVAELTTNRTVRINEVMSSNKTAYADDKGQYSDWIELINTGDTAVNLEGWALVDDIDKPARFYFPAHVLQPGELVVVFASDDLATESGKPFHAPFKLSASGDSVLLFDAGGQIAESINVPKLGANQVYARSVETGEFEVLNQYTPGLPNTPESFEQFDVTLPVENSPVVINEVMADNASYIRDEDGDFSDWVELANIGSEPVNLAGYALSDDLTKLGKWKLPEVTLQPGEYLVIYASGKDRSAVEGNLHANFKISAEREDVALSDSRGRLLSTVTVDNLATDRSLARAESGEYRTTNAPTPGAANAREGAALMERDLAALNTHGLFIAEAMASTTVDNLNKQSFDWLELHNRSSQAIDLSGYGLSDNPGRARKWQFPSGASIGPGERLVVYLSGNNKSAVDKQRYQTNFKLALDGEEILTLATPQGEIIDRMPMPEQYTDVAYGRIDGRDGFFYLETSTPGASNSASGFLSRAGEVHFSAPSGTQSGPVSVALSAEEGSVIYYTLDCSEPTTSSLRYEGPLSVSKTTIVRARAFRQDALPSLTTTATYFYGISHTMPVVSLVTDPANLWDENTGIYVKGPNALSEFPYGSIGRGANFWMRWEKAGNVEMFDTDGSVLISQGIGIALHGQYSRAEKQKAFSLTARGKYGASRIEGKLFPNRDYTEFQSVVLRGSGQDGKYSRMRDMLQTSLAENTDVMYQDARPVVVYLNGEYWGHYNLRERVNKHSIAQREGWANPDDVDLVKASKNVLNGSNEGYPELIEYVKKNGLKEEEHLNYLAERVDIDNYLDYVMLQIFTGNTDNGNIKRYRNLKADGKWRWVLYDLDWGFFTLDTNSVRRWLDPEGVGVNKTTDTTLFVKLMKNPTVRDRFLTRFGQMLATDFSTEQVLQKIDTLYEQLLPEMPANQEKWGRTMKSWKQHVNKLRNYAEKRPKYVIDCLKSSFKLDAEQMQTYFGEALEKINNT